MNRTIKSKLLEISDMLTHISDEEYTMSHTELSEATIGQHTRHIIELFQCLSTQYDNGEVCYDSRKRDIAIQTNTQVAKDCIVELVDKLDLPDKHIVVKHQLGEKQYSFQSSYQRELVYNLEHCVHHQALIKVALRKGSYQIPSSFGVAESTIRHRNCQ